MRSVRTGDVFEFQAEVEEGQPQAYAAASGDANPIHTDPEIAEAAGFEGVVLQGMCTMAFAHQAVTRWAGSDPGRVRRLHVRFAAPVYPGDELTFRGEVVDVEGGSEKEPAGTDAVLFTGGLARVELEALNQDGETVVENAFAEVEV